MMNLDLEFPELACVVVYLLADEISRQGGQTKLSATGNGTRRLPNCSPRVQAVPEACRLAPLQPLR